MTELFKTVLNLINAIHLALYELYERENRPVNDFCRGQTYAYVECLEIFAAGRLTLTWNVWKFCSAAPN